MNQEDNETPFELIKGMNLDPVTDNNKLVTEEKKQVALYKTVVRTKFNELFGQLGEELSKKTKVELTEQHITKVLTEAQKLGQSYCLEYVTKRRATLMKIAFDKAQTDEKNGFKYFEYLMGFIDGTKQLGEQTTVKKKINLSEIIK